MTKLFYLEQRHLLASACDSYYEADFPVALSPASPSCTFDSALSFTAAKTFGVTDASVTGFSVSGNSDRSWNVFGNLELKITPDTSALATTGTCVFPINGTVASTETLKSIKVTGEPEGRGDTGTGLSFGSILNKVDFGNGTILDQLPITKTVTASADLNGLTYASPEIAVKLKVCTDATESKISITGKPATVNFGTAYNGSDLKVSINLPATNNPNASLKMVSDAGFTAYFNGIAAQINKDISKNR